MTATPPASPSPTLAPEAQLELLNIQAAEAHRQYALAVQALNRLLYDESTEARRLRGQPTAFQQALAEHEARVIETRAAGTQAQCAVTRFLQRPRQEEREGPSVRWQREADEQRLNRLRRDLLAIGMDPPQLAAKSR